MNEIFLLAMTRSGSTLLQRAINQTPGMLMYGEHGGMLRGFAAAYYGADFPCLEKHSRCEPAILRDKTTFRPCHSCIEADHLRGNFRYFIESTFNPCGSPRWGFKEVRYGRSENNTQTVDMLIEMFPTCKFILLVRDPREQIESQLSMKWSMPNDAFREWENQFTFYSRLRRDHPDRCRMYHYEHLRDASRIFEWLQLECPVTRLFDDLPVTGATPGKCGITKILRTNIEEVLLPMFGNHTYD